MSYSSYSSYRRGIIAANATPKLKYNLGITLREKVYIGEKGEQTQTFRTSVSNSNIR